MKNQFIIYNTFTSQWGVDDCGPACVSMLLNYAGRYQDGERVMLEHISHPGGSSLLELRELLASFSIHSRCVTMDLLSLKSLDTPCILHTEKPDGEFHYLICFRAKRNGHVWQYLIADPEYGISWYPEQRLNEFWRSGAALYPEGLRFRLPKWTDLSWFALIRSESLPRIMLVSVPLLNLSATLLGIALSWLLQRGINSSLADRQLSLLVAIVILLSLIMFAKGLGNYVRQQILIKLNAGIRQEFMAAFTRRLYSTRLMESSSKKALAEIQMIQNAYTALFGVLFSEGTLVVILLSALCYFEPLLGCVNLLYVLSMTWLGAVNSLVVAGNQRSITEQVSVNDRTLQQALKDPEILMDKIIPYAEDQSRYSADARSFATLINRQNLLYDCLGIFSVITVLSCCFYYLRMNEISYTMLITEVVTSYFIAMLMPKICLTFPVISAGAQLIKKF